jgi:hypothetical protein
VAVPKLVWLLVLKGMADFPEDRMLMVFAQT